MINDIYQSGYISVLDSHSNNPLQLWMINDISNNNINIKENKIYGKIIKQFTKPFSIKTRIKYKLLNLLFK